jgi:hypothetical protein
VNKISPTEVKLQLPGLQLLSSNVRAREYVAHSEMYTEGIDHFQQEFNPLFKTQALLKHEAAINSLKVQFDY